MDTKAFTSFLHSNIPLTEFMDIQAETYTPEKVVLSKTQALPAVSAP